MYQIPASWDCRKCGAIGSVPVHRQDCQAHDAGTLAMSYPIRSLRLALPGAERMNEDGETTRHEMKLELAMVLDLIRKALVAIDLAAIGQVAA